MGCEKEVIEYQPVNLDLPIAILAHKVRPGVVEISPPKLVPSGLRFYPVRRRQAAEQRDQFISAGR